MLVIFNLFLLFYLIYFILIAKTYSAEECRATIYGTYHFTYEFREGGIGICDNPISRLVSCPDPGTPFDSY